ncbi:MAG: glycosyltransferase [Planctomycetota bacterium]|jgi:dolichyl-phosphate beta-glucosyltransferase
MDISIVIPVYKEREKIGDDIQAASKFLKENNFTGEIIVVDDGSKDGTADKAQSFESSLPDAVNLEVIHHERHRGKGYAVRTGILRANGNYVMFADSGLCVPFDNVLPGLDLIRQGKCDIANGSRKLKQTHIIIRQSMYRRICSRLFHWFVVYFMGLPKHITDSQCGFKIYSKEAAKKLYSECFTDGFTFDLDILLRAIKHGYKIKEFPIEWTCDKDTRLSPSRNIFRILSELIKIKRGIK